MTEHSDYLVFEETAASHRPCRVDITLTPLLQLGVESQFDFSRIKPHYGNVPGDSGHTAYQTVTGSRQACLPVVMVELSLQMLFNNLSKSSVCSIFAARSDEQRKDIVQIILLRL